MKFSNLLKMNLVSLVALIGVAEAGHPVYPPFVDERTHSLVFADSDNKSLREACTPSARVCARFYVLPVAYRLAQNEETNVPMLTQGIFPGRSRLDHRVVYNLTLEPDLRNLEGLKDYLLSSVSADAGGSNVYIREDQIAVAPLPVADMQFIATGLVGAEDEHEINDELQPLEVPKGDEAPELSEEELEKRVEKMVKNVYFTKFYAPKWTGDQRSLGQRFSVSIQGSTYSLEPAFQNMFLAKGGNAVIGTISFRFRALTTPLKLNFKCNLNTFQEVVNSTRKSWEIYRYQSRRVHIERFRNDEWNAIRSSLKVDDYCSVTSYQDLTIPVDQAVNQVRDLLFNKLLDRAFDAVLDQSAPKTVSGKDPKYTYYESKAVKESNAEVTLDVESNQVIWLSSDVDFQAGNIQADQLDPNHWTLCSHWERPTRQRTCESVCMPWFEVYWPQHPMSKVSDFNPDAGAVCVDYENILSK